MSTEMVTLIANTGGTLGLAIFAIYMLNKTWRDRLEEEKRNTEHAREMWRCTTDALEKNTAVITQLLERMEKK